MLKGQCQSDAASRGEVLAWPSVKSRQTYDDEVFDEVMQSGMYERTGPSRSMKFGKERRCGGVVLLCLVKCGE